MLINFEGECLRRPSSDPSNDEVITVESMPIVAGFEWSVGELMDRFISELANKKIFGAECSDCGYTYVPPRLRCGKCYSEMGKDELVELSGRGTLVSYTKASVELDGSGNLEDLDEPFVIGAIRLEGADSKIFMPIKEVDLDEVEEGMEVEVEWVEEPEGEISDIKYFKPRG